MTTLPRRITNEELAGLPAWWENLAADTTQNVQYAFEVDMYTYLYHKAEGGLCQEHQGRYYIALKDKPTE